YVPSKNSKFQISSSKQNLNSNIQTLTTRYSLLTTTIGVKPNPFTRRTTISYTLPIASKVTIKLYDATGRLVETLTNEYLNAGTYTTTLSSKNFARNGLAKGIYFLRYQDNTNQKEIKLIVE
ncbi:MAG: T9SS type A sorting domain-containing protein, partial [candidate division WOR-3 bacterium]|nr:T9SS type A sorting domain-containing protein [candidate division WOR-3 bacterium]